MTFVRSILPGVAGVLAMLCSSLVQAQASPLARYDAEHQALAVNPYADGYGGTINIDFDFDGDHAWAGVIDQGGWNYLFGDLTELGLSFSRTTCNPDGSCQTETLYGWGDSLGSLKPVQDFNTYVTSLSDSTEALNKFHYSVDTWDVAAGATTIYIRPMNSSNNSIPVMPEDASHIYIRVSSSPNGFDWRTLADLNPPEPEPVAVTVHISPRTLNLKSKGRWIKVRIELPAGYTADAVDLSSLALSVLQDIKDNNGLLQKSVRTWSPHEDHFRRGFRTHVCRGREEHDEDRGRQQGPPDRAHDDDDDGPEFLRLSHDDCLTVKFNRKDVQRLLHPGDALLTVSGKFMDGTVFEGSDTIRVIE